MFEVMFWPILACVLLPGLLVYLGLHVVQRGIIFIDIAMAQMAALGICTALLLHMDLQGFPAFAVALGFTLLGAAIFSITGKRASEVPQEAVIGITYVVAAAIAVILLSRSAEGDEEIKNMLVGNILLIAPEELWKTLGLFVGVGAFHALARKQFFLLTFDPQRARREGLGIRFWDFLFYASFGLVVTSFVRTVGVLLVFTYLIVPAVAAVLVSRRFAVRLAVGCAIALAGGISGLWTSYQFDLPTGAAIVCTLGLLLVLVGSITMARRRYLQREAPEHEIAKPNSTQKLTS